MIWQAEGRDRWERDEVREDWGGGGGVEIACHSFQLVYFVSYRLCGPNSKREKNACTWACQRHKHRHTTDNFLESYHAHTVHIHTPQHTHTYFEHGFGLFRQ